MIKEALQYIVDLNEPKIIERDLLEYSTKELYPIESPQMRPLTVNTLTGLIEYCDTFINNENKMIIHIKSEENVKCISMNVDEWSRRELYAVCTPIAISEFSEGQWYDLEDFIINIRTNFVESETIDKLIKILGNISDNEVKNYNDDGITQTAVARSGINFKNEVTLPSILSLAPYRTFQEIYQPESKFIFRMRKGENEPSCALFGTSSTRWKMQAIRDIKQWFEEELRDSPYRDIYTIIA